MTIEKSLFVQFYFSAESEIKTKKKKRTTLSKQDSYMKSGLCIKTVARRNQSTVIFAVVFKVK